MRVEHIVDDEADRRFRAVGAAGDARDAADRHGGGARIGDVGHEIRNFLREILQTLDMLALRGLAADDADRQRHVLGFLLAQARRHRDVVDIGARLGGAHLGSAGLGDRRVGIRGRRGRRLRRGPADRNRFEGQNAGRRQCGETDTAQQIRTRCSFCSTRSRHHQCFPMSRRARLSCATATVYVALPHGALTYNIYRLRRFRRGRQQLRSTSPPNGGFRPSPVAPAQQRGRSTKQESPASSRRRGSYLLNL